VLLFVPSWIFGLLVKRAPARAGVVAMILSPIIYGITMVLFGNIPFFVKHGITITSIAFLNRMTISFVLIILTMGVMTILDPLDKPKEMPVRHQFDMKPAAGVKRVGAGVIFAMIVLYFVFW
jgi:uncharacterized sodium:solute symporter family permease YidK